MSGLLASREEIEAVVSEYALLASAVNDTNRRKAMLREQIVQWMQLNDEDVLTEGESGATVRLVETRRPDTWDVGSMPEAMVTDLARRGALNVDGKVLKALAGKAAVIDDAAVYLMPGGVTDRLVVGDAAE